MFLHATGINGTTYLPLLKRLDFDGQIIVPSMRGHGRTELEAPASELKSWEILSADVLETLSTFDLQGPVILAGHSSGAVTSLLTARTLDVKRVLLLEPVVIPQPLVLVIRSPFGGFLTSRFKIAQHAAARRPDFPSREKARHAYEGRRFFAAWEKAAFDGYLDEGFREIPGGVTLSCEPSWESAMFKAQAHGFWPHLDRVRKRGVAVDILAAQDQSTFPLKGRPKAVRMGASLMEVEGGHMIPLEEPDFTAQWMRDMIAGVRASVRV